MTTTNPGSQTTGAVPVAIGLIGAGAIGAFHGETLARRLPGVRLAGVADPAPGTAERLTGQLGGMPAYTDAAELIADPDAEAIVIAAPAASTPG
jgi:myo-inositol 2-dehydrogenase/D-chiro-inositol 1-dehydrogenase